MQHFMSTIIIDSAEFYLSYYMLWLKSFEGCSIIIFIKQMFDFIYGGRFTNDKRRNRQRLWGNDE